VNLGIKNKEMICSLHREESFLKRLGFDALTKTKMSQIAENRMKYRSRKEGAR
jgi:hypothetical protein